jgi:hypothetical protein
MSNDVYQKSIEICRNMECTDIDVVGDDLKYVWSLVDNGLPGILLVTIQRHTMLVLYRYHDYSVDMISYYIDEYALECIKRRMPRIEQHK